MADYLYMHTHMLAKLVISKTELMQHNNNNNVPCPSSREKIVLCIKANDDDKTKKSDIVDCGYDVYTQILMFVVYLPCV